MDAVVLDTYAGIYRNEADDFTVHVTRDGDHLAIGEGGSNSIRLHPLSQERFLPESELPPLRFERDADGTVSSFVAEALTPLVFERVQVP
ncbi:MAG TPA: hypothetical protein VFG21_05180 [Xanthomonadaceae bacterium]|nr:hypothetical protein [Xanthomonadaceae bacterium]